MVQLRWFSTVSMLLITFLAKIDARPHLNQLGTLQSTVPYGLVDHIDYAPAVEALPWQHLPEPASLVPAPASVQIPIWPAQTLPSIAPAPAPFYPTATPTIPAFHQHLLPLSPAGSPLPTITQVLPPILEAVPFTSRYRAISGPKTTTTKVAIGYTFPKLLTIPHVRLRSSPLKSAHHLHSLF